MSIATITELALTTAEFTDRARWCRAGILNVHRYADAHFTFDGGRLVLRGTNGSGKSRAMDMLFPFLLSGDRRKMGSGTSGQVTIDSLMRVGLRTAVNRVGYVWAECRKPDGTYMTVGAFFRYSTNARQSNVAYFVTPLRVGHDLHLMDADRKPLPRKELTEVVGANRVTETPHIHRDRVAQELFGLTDDRGRARFRAYLDMLYKLRTPDIGVRIDNGEVTRLLSESLPPLSDDVLQNAGQQLDGLAQTRQQQQQLAEAAIDSADALEVYRGYAATVIATETERSRAMLTNAVAARNYEQESLAAEKLANTEYVDAGRNQDELTREVELLSAQKHGLEASQAYVDAQTMVQRDKTVQALEAVAITTHKALRDSRADLTRAIGRAVDAAALAETDAAEASSLTTAASRTASSAGIPEILPIVTVTVAPRPETAIHVRLSLHHEEIEETYAGVPSVHFSPFPLTEVTERLREVSDAGKARHDASNARLSAVTQLDSEAPAVEALEQQATESASLATNAATAAVAAASASEAERTRLASQWKEWVDSAETAELLSPINWDLSPVNPTAEDGVADLDSLDGLAETIAQPAQLRVSLDEAIVDESDIAAEREEVSLIQEREGLEAHSDQPPETHPWVTIEDGTPFWRAVDFVDGVPEHTRAAVETALHTAGVLTATLTTAGITPADGQLLVTAFGAEATNPITRILTVDANSGDGVAAWAVLSRIGFNDPSHPVNFNEDGSWRVGVMSGRPPAIVGPHYIGPSARENARQTRIARIGELLEVLADTRTALAEKRRTLQRTRKRITDVVAASPKSSAARTASLIAHTTAEDADRTRAARDDKQSAAEKARNAWDARFFLHRQACSLASLPVSSSKLRDVVDLARSTGEACRAASSSVTKLAGVLDRFTKAADEADSSELRAAEAQHTATAARAEWVAAATELDQMRNSAGSSVQEILMEIEAIDRELKETSSKLKTVTSELPKLSAVHATAKADVRTAAAAVADDMAEMLNEAQHLSKILGLPGVLEAAAGAPALPPEVTDIESTQTLLSWISSVVPQRKMVTVDAIHNVVDTLRERVAPAFDVNRHTREGVLLVELIDADGSQTLTAAAASIAELAARGREALLSSEYDIFQRFIIGGVAAELRRSIILADQTIKETNDRVAGYRTSNNIGVKLNFSPNESLGPDLVRIRLLVAIADEIRTFADTDELTQLLRAAVDAVFSDNPAGGYVTALTSALDYRKWFTVDAIVLGPAEGQQRALRRAGLSSGELRYVSYLTLICALDAHMTALPLVAPRLLLLDDAFAMVDDQGRRNLLKILVGRDIDFVMTGHDLWLAFPEVKSLDLYDIVATGEDNPATTVHYHWDGRQRSLRSA